jgi:hypothetical protein
MIEEFAAALNKAKDVSLADERPRTLRMLGDVAANIGGAVICSRDAVSAANETPWIGVGEELQGS